MKNCEWKNGIFYPCCEAYNLKHRYTPAKDNEEPFTSLMGIPVSYCSFCGSDIRKPEPKVIIKQSGGTWVARYDGVDYLLLDPYVYGKIKYMSAEGFKRELCHWKPISEIKITDEIAKLRPIVVFSDKLYFLIASKGGSSIIASDDMNGFHYDSPHQPFTKYIRLATVEDL